MNSWLIILAPLNILLFLLAILFIIPKNTWEKPFSYYKNNIPYHFTFLLLIIIVVIVHLIEVNVIDPHTTKLIGYDFTDPVKNVENGTVYWFSQHWTPFLLYFFVFIYIGLYPFLLWFSLLYFIIADERESMKTFTISLIIVYAIALPFYLFFPVTNVYTHYGLPSPLDSVIPTVEEFFYTTTTNNNCFPSLHVAISLLIAKTASLTNNKRFMYLTYFSAIGIICAVIYLAIHWITDVVGGILLVLGVFYLIKQKTKET